MTRAPDSRSHNKTQENPYLLVKNQVSVSANMIVSIFVMFGIGYYAAGSAFKDETTVSPNSSDSYEEDEPLLPLLASSSVR